MGSTTRRLLVIAGLIALVLVATAAFVVSRRTRPNPQAAEVTVDQGEAQNAPPIAPTLYCDFYDVMHNATVVSFYFFVDLANRTTPNVFERFVVEPDGTKTDFGTADGASLPQWSYSLDDGTPTIISTSTATVIVLYGLKPRTHGTFWVEAGLRSNDYRNLEGKCRQANFTEAAK